MVVYKRKPVRIEAPPCEYDDDTMVWQITETGEVYNTYDGYLDRMDFYKTASHMMARTPLLKQFSCEISGRSGLTFFEALKSEAAGAEEIEQTFPESLKGPLLRKVQFKTTSRLDNLVDMMYDEFKMDFFPGETILITPATGERLHGTVRDKVTHSRDGKQYSRYMVSVEEPIPQDHFCEAQQLSRDRKKFNKSVLRTFIKKTVTRDAWNGAPWLVRHTYANQFHIDTRVPFELSYNSKLQERKALQAQKRASTHDDDASIVNGGDEENKPHKSDLGRLLDIVKPESKPSKKQKKSSRATPTKDQKAVDQAPAAPPPPPPPKYPIEDLQVPRKHVDIFRPQLKFLCSNAPVDADLALNGDHAAPDADIEMTTSPVPYSQHIDMSSVGLLLETWDTLNVYCEIFKLDSFTFDDYVEAVVVSSGEVRIELFEEMHCAVLKTLVDETGKLQVSLPEMVLSDSESDSSRVPTPEQEATTEASKQPPLRATRSSLAKQEAERVAAEVAAADAEASIVHRADEILSDYDWVAEAGKRAFEDGGWQMMMVGLLYRLSRRERMRDTCNQVLAHLVPASITEPTTETVREQYDRMDVNLRVKALQVLCMLTYETKAFRAYMEECSEGMTQYRKDRVEWQRQRKQALEELRLLLEQKRALDAENNPDDQNKGDETIAEIEAKIADPDETMIDANVDADAEAGLDRKGAEENDEDDEDASSRRVRRRQVEKKNNTERARREKEERREREKAEAAARAAGTKQAKQYAKLLKDIARCEDTVKKCEDEVAIIENDLRESDCPRTRVLGKDRFWNRYYWFERNGMPLGGLPTSSTAEAGYANGCIWVQGPDDLEREGFIELDAELQAEYRAEFGVTVLERKREEEGRTRVSTATQWGFLADPAQVDELIGWLDVRGVNELKLKKELQLYRDKIHAAMVSRLAYLEKSARELEAQDEQAETTTTTAITNGNSHASLQQSKTLGIAKRTRTRGVATIVPTRTFASTPSASVSSSPEPRVKRYRCQKWTNLTALEELGHLHSQNPPVRKKRGRKRGEAAAELDAVASSPPRKTRRR